MSGDQGLDSVVALPVWAGRAYRPAVEHAQLFDFPVGQSYPADHLIQGVVAFRRQFKQLAMGFRRSQDAVQDGFCFANSSQNIATVDMRSAQSLRIRSEMPAPVARQ